MQYKERILILCFFMGSFMIGKAQEISTRNIPDAVSKAFTKQYPAARDIEWKQSGSDYKVSFEIKKVDHKATYNSAGEIISTAKDIRRSSLPKIIAANIKSKYPQARIDDAEQINTSGKITYKVDLDGNPNVSVWYSDDGNFIKEVAD